MYSSNVLRIPQIVSYASFNTHVIEAGTLLRVRTYNMNILRAVGILMNPLRPASAAKSSCPNENLWVKLIMFFQPKRNKNRCRKGKVKN